MYGHEEFPPPSVAGDLPIHTTPPVEAAGPGIDGRGEAGDTLYVVPVQRERVQKGRKVLYKELMCPLHSKGDEDVEEVVETAGWGARPRVCTVEWLTGRILDGGERLDNEVVDCFETHPYAKDEWPDKTDRERRFFMWHTIAKELGCTGARDRGEPSRCVKERVQSLYGASQRGFSPSR